MNNLLKIFASPKTALILIIHLITIAFIAVMFPTKENFEFTKSYYEIFNNSLSYSFNYQDKFDNVIVFSLLVSCCIGILISIFLRIKAEYKNLLNRLNTEKNFNIASENSFYIEIIKNVLRKNKYRVFINTNVTKTSIIGEKGKLGVLGSIMFHFSLIIICIGIFLSKFASFHGSFDLTEGEIFSKYKVLNIGQFYRNDSDIPIIRLISYIPRLEVNNSTTDAAVVEYYQSGIKKIDTIFVNNPLKLNDKKIYLGSKVGYSPYIEIINNNGSEIFSGFVRLANMQISGNSYHKDFIYFDSVRVELEFFPNTKIENELTDPYLVIKVNGDKQVLNKAALKAKVGDYTVSYLGYRRWVSLDIKHDPGVMIIFFGAVLGSLGLIFRILFVKRKIIVNLYEKESIIYDFAFSSEKFYSLYKDDLIALSSQIENTISDVLKKSESQVNMVN